ncbi:hypothetical protein GMMP1_540053 [Candidatus Magnetomoraceae bacterium gMMP-1]
MNYNYLKIIIITCISFVSGIYFAFAGSIIISPLDINAEIGSSFVSEIKVNVENSVLGSYNFIFNFDKDALEIEEIQGGTTLEFSKLPIHSKLNNANKIGSINIAAFNTKNESPRNLVSIFRIKFKVIGKLSSSSRPRPDIINLLDPDSNIIMVMQSVD